jgi:hypothetical protein
VGRLKVRGVKDKIFNSTHRKVESNLVALLQQAKIKIMTCRHKRLYDKKKNTTQTQTLNSLTDPSEITNLHIFLSLSYFFLLVAN